MIYPQVEPGVKALIFDLDGTLADSIPVHIHCWEETCNTFNYQFPVDMMIKMTGMPTRNFAEYIKQDSGCELSIDEIMHLKQNHFYKLANTIKPVEKVAQFVKDNFGKIPMSIGTGGGKRSSGMILEAIGMKDYFDIIVTADDVTRHKPDPDTFLKCAELMGVKPEACQVFEDGEKGMEAGYKAGMIVTDVRQYY